MTRAELETKAAQKGIEVHSSVTDEVLSKVNSNIMLGHAADAKTFARRTGARKLPREFKAADVRFIPYKIGSVGEIVYALPTAARGVVEVPRLEVLGHVTAKGESVRDTDDEPRKNEMYYTAFRYVN